MNAILHTLPDVVLFDLDGTLYRGDEPIAGADALVAKLEEQGISCWFVTNNSSRTPVQVARHLESLGISAKPERIVTSATAAADYASRHYPGASAYVIGEQGLREALTEAGLRLSEPDSAEEGKRLSASTWSTGEEPSGQDRKQPVPALVVQGIDRWLTYDKLALATGYLLQGAVYIETNPDLLLPVVGRFLPGAGAIGASLAAASGTKPIVIGKPSAIMMDYALRRAGVPAAKAWVVGDNPYTDLAAAKAAGCPSVLVLTGLCTGEDWQRRCAEANVTPDAVCSGPDELAAIVTRLWSA